MRTIRHGFERLSCQRRLLTLPLLPMTRRAAIHASVTVVSWRTRVAPGPLTQFNLRPPQPRQFLGYDAPCLLFRTLHTLISGVLLAEPVVGRRQQFLPEFLVSESPVASNPALFALEVRGAPHFHPPFDVNMVGHEANGVDQPLRFGGRFIHGRQKPLAILIILEDGLAAVAAAHHVIDRARIFDSQGAGHRQGLPRGRGRVNKRV